MFEIPLNLILINPAIDIFVFVFLFYFFTSKFILNIFKKSLSKSFLIDIQITFIFLVLGYLNYKGTDVKIFSLNFSWFTYIIVLQFLAEVFFIFPFRKNFLEKSK
jgi:hypothetical protein